jgi:hypothetical protein
MNMHNLNQMAAEQHELAAEAHRKAAEHDQTSDNPADNWNADRALEYSNRAYALAQEAHVTALQNGELNA